MCPLWQDGPQRASLPQAVQVDQWSGEITKSFFYERKLPPRLLQLHRAAEPSALLVSTQPEAHPDLRATVLAILQEERQTQALNGTA